MNTVAWAGQIFLAVTFLYSGIMKATQTREKLMSIGQTGVYNLSYLQIRSLASIELAGVAGILLPWYLKILPVLTPITAFCFALVMVFAMTIHAKRKEWKSVTLNVVLLVIALVTGAIRLNIT
jgi:uncharacterized membrane protein YphA (DoxX/SURF4 family)